jgi:hypothetical protein
MKADTFRKQMVSDYDEKNKTGSKMLDNALKNTGQSANSLKSKADSKIGDDQNEPLSEASTGSMGGVQEPREHSQDRSNVKNASAGERAKDAAKNPHQYAVDSHGNSVQGEM